jgi:hypothetical protein
MKYFTKKNELLERVNELLSYQTSTLSKEDVETNPQYWIQKGIQKGLGGLPELEKLLLKWEKNMENNIPLNNVKL